MSNPLPRFLAAGVVLVILFFQAGTLVSSTRKPDLQQRLGHANKAYTQGRYKDAIAGYNDLIGDYGLSPELLHNLANSYAADGRYGRAVLNYLRALRLAPAADDLRADLALIRKKVGLFNDERTLSERFFSYYTMNQWLTRALLGYILLTIVLALNSRFHFKKGVYGSSLTLAGLIIICCISAYSQRQEWDGGVVTEPDTRLLLSPFKTAASNGSLLEGTLVYSKKLHEDYHYVMDERGRSGWIPSASFEPINTTSFTYRHGDAGR